MHRTKYTKNRIVSLGDYSEMYLYNAFGIFVAKTKIDKEDAVRVSNYKWNFSTKGYIKSIKAGWLHRFLMNTPKGMVTDHINFDRLDNRKSNLRICTNQENLFNRSKAKGHYWSEEKKKWYAKIMLNRRNIHLGYFKTKKQAIIARRNAELRYFGNFAPQYI